jgi:hypothetical protein
MSLVVPGPRRIYVVLLSRERLIAPRAPAEEPSRRIEHALTSASEACGARVVLSAPVHRRWGDSLFGLSLFVIASERDCEK